MKGTSEWMGYRWEGPDTGPATPALLYGEYMRDQDANAGVPGYVLGCGRNKCAAPVTVRDWLADWYPDAVAPCRTGNITRVFRIFVVEGARIAIRALSTTLWVYLAKFTPGPGAALHL